MNAKEANELSLKNKPIYDAMVIGENYLKHMKFIEDATVRGDFEIHNTDLLPENVRMLEIEGYYISWIFSAQSVYWGDAAIKRKEIDEAIRLAEENRKKEKQENKKWYQLQSWR